MLGELSIGFLLGGRRERNEKELLEFLSNPVVEGLLIDADTARTYAEIVVELRKAGTPIPTNDIWIAACAAQAGETALTYDPHSQAVRRVGALALPDSQSGSGGRSS